MMLLNIAIIYLTIAGVFFLMTAGYEWARFIFTGKLDTKMPITSKDANITYALLSVAWLVIIAVIIYYDTKNFLKKIKQRG